MALERRNPLPPGRYSIFVIGPENIAAFNAWLTSVSELVKVESSELIEPTVLQDAKDVQQFVIFRVTPAPVPFEQTRFGFPSIAGPEVKSSGDTVQQPDLPADDAPERFTKLILIASGTVAVAAVLYAIGTAVFAARARRALAGAA